MDRFCSSSVRLTVPVCGGEREAQIMYKALLVSQQHVPVIT